VREREGSVGGEVVLKYAASCLSDEAEYFFVRVNDVLFIVQLACSCPRER
jgi:hypothetical protein